MAEYRKVKVKLTHQEGNEAIVFVDVEIHESDDFVLKNGTKEQIEKWYFKSALSILSGHTNPSNTIIQPEFMDLSEPEELIYKKRLKN